MTEHPRLKLCTACDQVSFARGVSRAPRCWRVFAGRVCGSRHVRFLPIDELNDIRLQQRLELAVLQERVDDLEIRHDALERAVEDLRRQPR